MPHKPHTEIPSEEYCQTRLQEYISEAIAHLQEVEDINDIGEFQSAINRLERAQAYMEWGSQGYPIEPRTQRRSHSCCDNAPHR
ncbi:hypothetical protein [Roseofilum casamattae]|uniref:Uncharacterized protein n=1 Tax=Roseofilum casamattae BLCC-M143 TaxID=3022442 RepID=A0ABT7C1F2_9CYAN|nr:hypothetical protein [Roseofilum casamattae]MDJ1185260.1 hypothetical protein [Roseofilum casamattae BLCC-M143]